MHPTELTQAKDLVQSLTQLLSESQSMPHVVLAPSFVHLHQVADFIKTANAPLTVAAQNLCAHSQDKGAFTGEISAAQLKDIGVSAVIIGHSERRQYFHEDNACLTQKIACALAQGLQVIFCVGETESDYEAHKTNDVIAEQLSVLKDLPVSQQDADAIPALIVAYEPVWAIGTGKVPTVSEVNAVHGFIQSTLCQYQPQLVHTPVLYGGSVKADNVTEFAQCPNVAGVLVGGASLDAASFYQIIQAFSQN